MNNKTFTMIYVITTAILGFLGAIGIENMIYFQVTSAMFAVIGVMLVIEESL